MWFFTPTVLVTNYMKILGERMGNITILLLIALSVLNKDHVTHANNQTVHHEEPKLLEKLLNDVLKLHHGITNIVFISEEYYTFQFNDIMNLYTHPTEIYDGYSMVQVARTSKKALFMVDGRYIRLDTLRDTVDKIRTYNHNDPISVWTHQHIL